MAPHGWTADETGFDEEDDGEFWCAAINGPCPALSDGWDCPAYGCAIKAGVDIDEDL